MVDLSNTPDRIAAMRRFNRFYTQRVGALNEGLLDSPLPLPEARLLYEIGAREQPLAATLARELRLDPGYVSRLLRSLERRGYVERRPSPSDGRQSLLSLSAEGKAAFAVLNGKSDRESADILAGLPETDQHLLVGAMRTIESLLGGPRERGALLLRPHRPGDMGWVVHRQALLYAREHGWDGSFEAMLAEIVGRFLREFDARRECCWIAEQDGEIVGSAFLVGASETVAQLRMLYVEQAARGQGLGRRLVEECIRFARQAGYAKISLWTNDILTDARKIYERAGFRLVGEERHRSFGKDLVGQTFELEL